MNDNKRITQETPIITTLPPDDLDKLVGRACIRIIAMPDGTCQVEVAVSNVVPTGEYTVFVDLLERNRTGLMLKS